MKKDNPFQMMIKLKEKKLSKSTFFVLCGNKSSLNLKFKHGSGTILLIISSNCFNGDILNENLGKNRFF